MGSQIICRGADFCEEIAGDSDTTFKRVYDGLPPSRRIVSTKSFIVLADLSPLTVGHLLILPRDHYLSFAEVLLDHVTELQNLLDWLLTRYRDTFGEPTILEHGSTSDFDQSACITHAHWHIVPVAGYQIKNVLIADNLSATNLCAIANLGSPPFLESAYFLLWYEDTCLAFRPHSSLRRQYLRSAISKPLGIPEPEWDYAVIVRKNYLRATLNQTNEWK